MMWYDRISLILYLILISNAVIIIILAAILEKL